MTISEGEIDSKRSERRSAGRLDRVTRVDDFIWGLPFDNHAGGASGWRPPRGLGPYARICNWFATAFGVNTRNLDVRRQQTRAAPSGALPGATKLDIAAGPDLAIGQEMERGGPDGRDDHRKIFT